MKILKATLSLFFASLILVMSSGFVINKHYCAGELQAVAINHSPESCHQGAIEKAAAPCHEEVQAEICHSTPSDDCCQDESEAFKTDHYTADYTQWESNVPVLIFFVPVFQILFSTNESTFSKSLLAEESPPRLPQNIRVLLQSFLL